MLLMCYTSTESLGLSELNDTNIIYFGVPGRIPQAVESTNFTTTVFICRTSWRPNRRANYLSVNIGLTCIGSENVLNWESGNLNGREHWRTPFKIRFGKCSNIFRHMVLNFAAWICYPCNLYRNHQEKRRWVAKINASKLLICRLENSRYYAKQLITWQNLASEGNWPSRCVISP